MAPLSPADKLDFSPPEPGMGMNWILSDKSELHDELSLIRSTTLLAVAGTHKLSFPSAEVVVVVIVVFVTDRRWARGDAGGCCCGRRTTETMLCACSQIRRKRRMLPANVSKF